MPSDQPEPYRLTAAERLHEVTMAALTRPSASPEHSLALTRNAKGAVQIDLTVRGHDLSQVIGQAVLMFDELTTRYPMPEGGAA
jgi:hypothetical protein